MNTAKAEKLKSYCLMFGMRAKGWSKTKCHENIIALMAWKQALTASVNAADGDTEWQEEEFFSKGPLIPREVIGFLWHYFLNFFMRFWVICQWGSFEQKHFRPRYNILSQLPRNVFDHLCFRIRSQIFLKNDSKYVQVLTFLRLSFRSLLNTDLRGLTVEEIITRNSKLLEYCTLIAGTDLPDIEKSLIRNQVQRVLHLTLCVGDISFFDLSF
jgi:hypothetical protein